ncbi:MAG: HD-GYP domain-containing protein [Lachnospiraceae bacterium]
MADKKILFSFELEPGMIVAEDVYRSNGVMLFPKHTMLNEMMIEKLPLYNIMELPIVDGPIEKPEIDIEKLVELAKQEAAAKEKNATAEKTYASKVKSSPEFKSFSENYEANITQVNDTLNKFITGEQPLDTEKLVNDTLNLMKGSSLHIFDMLHNLQAHDDTIFVHSTNVALIAAAIGRWLSLEEKSIHELTLAGLLHDLGKTAIPVEILNKPGKLSDEEFDIIKTHPKKSYELIRELPLDIRIKEACLLHHERCDGSGYPFGISGNKISEYAKIIAIADVYDAMTSPRSYREALCPFKAIELFERDGLYKYDPKFIMTFLENIGASYLHNNVRLSDGRIGEVVMLNKISLSNPMINCNGDFIDLTKYPELSIEAIV